LIFGRLCAHRIDDGVAQFQALRAFGPIERIEAGGSSAARALELARRIEVETR
jgi:hypothetical protein